MPGIGFAVAFLGYWTMYYGVTQVQGGNWGFLDLGIPSCWAKGPNPPRDSSGQGGVATSGGVVAMQPGAGSASGHATQPVLITPSGNGFGVDLNGNTYKMVNGQWQLYQTAGSSAPLQAA